MPAGSNYFDKEWNYVDRFLSLNISDFNTNVHK